MAEINFIVGVIFVAVREVYLLLTWLSGYVTYDENKRIIGYCRRPA